MLVASRLDEGETPAVGRHVEQPILLIVQNVHLEKESRSAEPGPPPVVAFAVFLFFLSLPTVHPGFRPQTISLDPAYLATARSSSKTTSGTSMPSSLAR